MNCAKCAKPPARPLLGEDRPYCPQIRLLKMGEVGDCEKYRCPRCHAIFFFPKDTDEALKFDFAK